MNLSKAQRMLLGIAIGDAFGRVYEGKSRSEIKSIFQPNYYLGDKSLYTDDAQMSIAVAETMLSKFGFQAQLLLSNFVLAYRRDKRSGYSGRTQNILEKSYCGKDFLDLCNKVNLEFGGTKAKGNGNVMRCLPLGLYKNMKDVIKCAKSNSEITHGHPDAINSCIALSLASHALYYNKCKPNNLISFIIEHMEETPAGFKKYLKDIDNLKETDYRVILGEHADKGLPCNSLKTMGIVLFITKNYYNSPNEALKQAIIVGGDVDSSGCLVLGLVLINNSLDKLSAFLFDGLENKKYGRDYLIDLGKKLSEKFPVSEKI